MIVDDFIVKNKIKKMNNDEIERYCAKNKNKMSCRAKEFALLQYASNLQEKWNTCVSSIAFKKMDIRTDGTHSSDEKKILINSIYVYNKFGIQSFSTIDHELTHSLQQDYIEQNPNDERAKLLDYSMNKRNETIDFCNFQAKEINTYISLYNPSEKGTEYSSLFYHLCISEREAFLATYQKELEICELFGNKKESIINKVDKKARIFKKIYKCENLTNEEIFSLVDEARTLLIEKRYPNKDKHGNLVANIMYDMCAVMFEKVGLCNYEVYRTSVKHNALLQYGYSHIEYEEKPSNLLQDETRLYSLGEKTEEDVKKMPKEIQNDNPILMMMATIYTNGKAIPYLKDKEFLYEYIINNSSTGPDIFMKFEDFKEYYEQKQIDLGG